MTAAPATSTPGKSCDYVLRMILLTHRYRREKWQRSIGQGCETESDLACLGQSGLKLHAGRSRSLHCRVHGRGIRHSLPLHVPHLASCRPDRAVDALPRPQNYHQPHPKHCTTVELHRLTTQAPLANTYGLHWQREGARGLSCSSACVQCTQTWSGFNSHVYGVRALNDAQSATEAASDRGKTRLTVQEGDVLQHRP